MSDNRCTDYYTRSGSEKCTTIRRMLREFSGPSLTDPVDRIRHRSRDAEENSVIAVIHGAEFFMRVVLKRGCYADPLSVSYVAKSNLK